MLIPVILTKKLGFFRVTVTFDCLYYSYKCVDVIYNLEIIQAVGDTTVIMNYDSYW